MSRFLRVSQNPLYAEALQTQREVLGPDHPDTLLCMNNMAVLCYRKRDLLTAKTLMREAASGRKRVLVSHLQPSADTLTARMSFAHSNLLQCATALDQCINRA